MRMSCLSFKIARTYFTNVSCFSMEFHLFLFLEALQGFVRLWEVLEGFEKFWEALEGSAGFAKFCKALGGFVGRF